MALICFVPIAACAQDVDPQLLNARLMQLKSAPAIPQSAIAAPEVVVALYGQRGNSLLWDETRRQSLLTALAASDLEGLNPRDYNVEALTNLPPLNELAGEARVDADLDLTDALLRYIYHLRFGKVNPAIYDPTWNFPRRVRNIDPIAALSEMFGTNDFAEALASYSPKSPLYRGLKAQLARYRAIAASGGWPLVDTKSVLKPGATDPSVRVLRQRLAREGFVVSDPESSSYDAPLEEVVRQFQRQNGLGDDGVIGARTLSALNTTPEARVDQIRVNLERLRWIEGARTSRFLAINIAGFEAHLIEDGRSVWSARVVVGMSYRRTPVFVADMKYVVFNPDWTVPPTILRDDVLPALKKDPAYLTQKHMEVIDRNGSPIDPATIDWRRYPASPFPYMIRQVPGPWNVLGRVKFMFPNPNFVFLHDTPSRQLFEKPERTFSSGCIRIERPFELVQLLLPDWDAERVDEVLWRGAQTTVRLPQPVPVLVVYLTSLALQDGTVRFYRDIYQRDGSVLTALSAGFVYDPPGALPAG
jgi:murein L,D-transpeptidase YcbB/YkuD